ncbi:MAG TPA: multidrug effflux MFS transporter [Sphingomonas sp.]|nr:multidrug effflux MFS transporter [Sphingomonas sp.]
MTEPAANRPTDTPPLRFGEFVTLIAALMALGSLGIDSMLPALPAIGASLGVVSENERQLIVTAFLIGMGLGQLIHGPLADRFGRRPVMIVALVVYFASNVAASLAGSFALMLAARAVGGVAIAATRVVTIALVRDCFTGRAMARVMSLAFIVFMIMPVLAPTFGQTILLFGEWEWIFAMTALGTAIVVLWFAIRMPETLHPEDRRPLAPARLARGWWRTLTDRWSLGYTLASAALLGALYGYINSVQQIMFDTFHRPKLLVVVFAITASTMALANFLNSRLVMRLGTRVISHVALLTQIALSAIHLAIALAGYETLATFIVLQALTMGCFGLATSNFSAMAMENMGHIAGSASSVQGFIGVTGGALIGAMVGQAFHGTTVPLYVGFFGAGVVALAVILVTERGRLFRPHMLA